MTHKRTVAGLVVATVAAGVFVPAATAAPVIAAQGPQGTVTLVTGDRVTLGGPSGLDVTPARGREHIGITATTDERGHVNVVPRDAAALVDAGRVDPRLFDVTALISTGYDDASRPELPLIVDGATTRAAQVVRELPSVGATAVRVQRSGEFWAAASTQADRIWLDGPVEMTLDRSAAQISAPTAWEAGFTGAGTTVAVLDTGIDVTHPDLDDAVTAQENFSESDTTDDRRGHGTHVASTITGDSTKYRGIAPDTTLLNGKVLGDEGGGSESGVIAGMEWAAANGADVINMSLGSPWPSDGTDPLSLALNRIAAESGALFVVAAGNSGPGEQSIGSPAAADAALTVGAVDRDDQLAAFSSRGPRWQNDAIKPDITAPGVGIVAAKAKNGVIGDPVEDGYVALNGTSMATPHVAGAAAILAGQHPEWTAEQLKAHLMGSAVPNESLTVFEQGAGRVDVAAAVTSPVSAAPASISNGVVQWPHDDDQPIATPVTFTNSGTEPITLDLTVDTTAPPGMFTAAPAKLTIPAGGQANATVTTDTGVDAKDGIHTGALVATAGEVTVRTPLTVTREVESYDMTLTFIDRNGAPTANHFFRFMDLATRRGVSSEENASTLTVRIPKGTYYFDGWIDTGEQVTQLAEPTITVTGDSELVFDARDGRQAGIQVDEPTARPGNVLVEGIRQTEWGNVLLVHFRRNFDGFFVRPSRTSAPGRFTHRTRAELAEPDGTGTSPGFANSPYLYHVEWSADGVVPAEQSRRFTNEQLAKVRSTHAVSTPGLLGVRNDMVVGQLPFTLTEYYTPGVEWYDRFFDTTDPASGSSVNLLDQADGRSYKKGKVTEVRWNVGVHGPAFPREDYSAYGYAGRLGDELLIEAPLAADQEPGREGWTAEATGESVLLRDGREVARGDFPGAVYVPVMPVEDATYTFRTNADRPFSRLSTVVSSEWTFRTGHVAGEEPAALPLLAVRYAPNLDDHNAAPAGRKFRFPVYVQRNGAETGSVNTPKVEVSYDDGKSWRAVRLDRKGAQWQATVEHPRGAEFVSLRSTVSDKDGNKATQTIVRAYALK
jgi:subtilisin family serine protease